MMARTRFRKVGQLGWHLYVLITKISPRLLTAGMLEQFGEKRVIDTPITEYGFAGIAVGAALG
jgi:hypothetical protein